MIRDLAHTLVHRQGRLWLLVYVVLLAQTGQGQTVRLPPVGIAPDPAVGAPLKGLQLFEGWGEPRELKAPVNTILGWEDSAFISYDGATLFFAYSQVSVFDVIKGVFKVIGPRITAEVPLADKVFSSYPDSRSREK